MDASFLTILYQLLSRHDKKILANLLLSSIMVSIIETIGISAIMIFIGMTTNLDVVTQNNYTNLLYTRMGITEPVNFVMIIGIVLICFYILRAIINTIHIYHVSAFAHMRQHHFATRIFQTYLNLSYKQFAETTSTTVSQLIFSFSGNITQMVNGLLAIATEFFTITCIYSMLFYVNWKMTLVLTIFLALKVFIVIKTFSPRIARAGQRSRNCMIEASKTYTASFWNFKFLKLLSLHEPLEQRFHNATQGFAQANTINAVWQSLPRFVLETIGFIMLISIMIYVLFMYHNASFVIPIVSMYALAFYRFLPSINKMVNGYNQVIFNKHAVEPIYNFLKQPYENLGESKITFNKTITCSNISFNYSDKSEILYNANLTIHKGERVGFIGESGAGKSTIVDIIMGLLPPAAGSVIIDNVTLTQENIRSWRQKIGYIPQTIFLFDGTVADNIICDRAYDKNKIITALKKACIYNFLQTQEGIDTWIGENGINLSGGQKQRIAIARALYAEPEILVLDEATSALDNETEATIMQEIYQANQDKTLIIIAHRLSTIQQCDHVYKIEHKMINPVQLVPSQQAMAQAH